MSSKLSNFLTHLSCPLGWCKGEEALLWQCVLLEVGCSLGAQRATSYILISWKCQGRSSLA